MTESSKKPDWADSKRNVEKEAPAPAPSRPSTAAQSTTSSSTRFDAHHRFVAWAALLFCSIISLAAKVTDTWDSPRATDEWFVIVVSAVSIGCAFFAIMGYAIARWKFPGSVFEGLFAVMAQLTWICGMPVIMDPGRSIAVSKGRSYELGETQLILEGEEKVGADFTYIRNANIYFFSWLSTIATVYICGRFARAITIRHNVASWTGLWYLSTLASLVVLVDSVELFKAFDCVKDDLGSGLCLSTTYALSLGCVGTLLGFIASLLATFGMFPQWAELLFSILIFCLYMAGVTMITFNDGPGTSIGNLYFATWMGTGVAAFVLGRSYHALIQSYMHRKDPKNKKDDQKLPDNVETPEEPVEFPDIEMGDEKAAKKEEKDEDTKDENDVPSWVQEEEEAEVDASVPSGKKPKDETEEEEGVEVEAEVPVKPNAEEPSAKKETQKEKEKATNQKEKRNSKLKKKEPAKREQESKELGKTGGKKEADKKEEKKAQAPKDEEKKEKAKPKEKETEKGGEKKAKEAADNKKKEPQKEEEDGGAEEEGGKGRDEPKE